MVTYFNIFNYIIKSINEILYDDKFMRFKINNLLSSNFPNMIYFMWKEIDTTVENTSEGENPVDYINFKSIGDN